MVTHVYICLHQVSTPFGDLQFWIWCFGKLFTIALRLFLPPQALAWARLRHALMRSGLGLLSGSCLGLRLQLGLAQPSIGMTGAFAPSVRAKLHYCVSRLSPRCRRFVPRAMCGRRLPHLTGIFDYLATLVRRGAGSWRADAPLAVVRSFLAHALFELALRFASGRSLRSHFI